MNDLVDGPVTVHVGDALAVLREMPAESIQCVVTSPPYWGLRDYGTAAWEGGDPACDHKLDTQHQKQGATSQRQGRSNTEDQRNENFRSVCGKCGARRVDIQLGLEPTPELYVEHMVEVFREVRRVLRKDGTLWLNLGDSYASSSTYNTTNSLHSAHGWKQDGDHRPNVRANQIGLKAKDMVGIPWMVAFALRADGWYLRSDVIWYKPNPMPESVTDRPTKAHEYLFLLTKSADYFYDAEAIKEQGVNPANHMPGRGMTPTTHYHPANGGNADLLALRNRLNDEGSAAMNRNKRSVWEIATQPYPEAHFATFPPDLVIPCVKSGTSEHGCCPECGAPWERVVDRKSLDRPDLPRDHPEWRPARYDNGKAGDPQGPGAGQRFTESSTLGWQPTCKHSNDLVPCTVLDPFVGSGTTLAVARRLGRRSVGIELQANYLPLIEKRITESSLPLLEALES
jgi:DNA modification methylase